MRNILLCLLALLMNSPAAAEECTDIFPSREELDLLPPPKARAIQSILTLANIQSALISSSDHLLVVVIHPDFENSSPLNRFANSLARKNVFLTYSHQPKIAGMTENGSTIVGVPLVYLLAPGFGAKSFDHFLRSHQMSNLANQLKLNPYPEREDLARGYSSRSGKLLGSLRALGIDGPYRALNSLIYENKMMPTLEAGLNTRHFIQHRSAPLQALLSTLERVKMAHGSALRNLTEPSRSEVFKILDRATRDAQEQLAFWQKLATVLNASYDRFDLITNYLSLLHDGSFLHSEMTLSLFADLATLGTDAALLARELLHLDSPQLLNVTRRKLPVSGERFGGQLNLKEAQQHPEDYIVIYRAVSNANAEDLKVNGVNWAFTKNYSGELGPGVYCTSDLSQARKHVRDAHKGKGLVLTLVIERSAIEELYARKHYLSFEDTNAPFFNFAQANRLWAKNMDFKSRAFSPAVFSEEVRGRIRFKFPYLHTVLDDIDLISGPSVSTDGAVKDQFKFGPTSFNQKLFNSNSTRFVFIKESS